MPSLSSATTRLWRAGKPILQNSRYFWLVAGLAVAVDFVLTQCIIRYISYTEIDWETYMIQTKVYLQGQHNYSMIEGPTGPVVYPAGHVHIHRFLYDITDKGRDIRLAQQIYAALYLLTQVISCTIYYRAGNIPNWIVVFLASSKRLHSIFVLRLFNDCWATFITQAAILAYQYGLDDTGTLLLSAALSVKMSVLLYLPGLLVILFKRRGLVQTFLHVITIGIIQVMIGLPFIQEDWRSYAVSAFNFGRVFLYKWTVNWRMFDEELFLSSWLSNVLLISHLSALIAFGLFKWCKPDGNVWKVLSRGLRRPSRPAGLSPISPDYVATVLFTSNLIGIIFARSLHYQFYSWYAHQIPFLAWRTHYPTFVKVLLIVGIEYSWNVFPSTFLSSSVLLGANTVLLLGIWFGDANGISIKAKKRTKTT